MKTDKIEAEFFNMKYFDHFIEVLSSNGFEISEDRQTFHHEGIEFNFEYVGGRYEKAVISFNKSEDKESLLMSSFGVNKIRRTLSAMRREGMMGGRI